MERALPDTRDRKRRRAIAAALVGILILVLVFAGALLTDEDAGAGTPSGDPRPPDERVADAERLQPGALATGREGATEPAETPAPIQAVPVAVKTEPGEPAAATATDPVIEPPPPATPPVPTVLVSVYDSVTKKPLAGAGIAEISGPLAPYRPDLEPSATTGPDGTVRLPEGKCYVVMPASYAARFVDLREPPKARIIVEVHRAVAFTGQVIDDRGIPLPGIAVQAGAITRLDRGSGSEADRNTTPACDAGRWTVSITDHGGNFAIAGIPAGQVLVEILDDGWFFRDPPPIRTPVLPGQEPPRVLIELAPITVAAVVIRGAPVGAPLQVEMRLPSVPPRGKVDIPPESQEARRGHFQDLRRRVLRELAAGGFPKVGTSLHAGVLAVRPSDAFVRPTVTISLPGAPGLPLTVPVRTPTVPSFDPEQATVVDLHAVDLGRLVPVRLRFRNDQGGAATWVPPLRLSSGILPGPHRIPDAANAAEAGVVTLHLPPGVWELRPENDAPWREPWSFLPLKLSVEEAGAAQDVILDQKASIVELAIEDPFGRRLRGFEFDDDVTTSSWDPDRGIFAALNRSGVRTLTAFNGRRRITVTIPQHRLRPGVRSRVHIETGDPHEF